MKRTPAMERIRRNLAGAVPAAAIAIAVAAAAVVAQAAEVTVTQRGKRFVPNEVTISVGDTVNFVNDDNITHNVFSKTDNHEFDIGPQKVGVTTSHTFTESGIVEVRCAIHPKMKLTVTIK